MNTNDYIRVKNALEKAENSKGLTQHIKILTQMLSNIKNDKDLDYTERMWLNMLFE